MMATPWGPSAVPTGGAGVAWPAGIWIFTTARTFFLAMDSTCLREWDGDGTACQSAAARRHWDHRLELGDLRELELDRGLAAEDVDQHLELQLVLVDLDDLAREVGEGPLSYPDRLAHLVFESRLGAGD